MPVIYVPRSLGSTLILTVGAGPASPVPTAVVLVTFRDGETKTTFRDGETKATLRDGLVQVGER